MIGSTRRSENCELPWQSHRLWSLWDMLQSYFPIYEIALKLSELRSQVEYRKSSSGLWKTHAKRYHDILVMLQRECQNHNFIHASEMVRRAMNVRRAPETSAHLFYELTHLNDSLGAELEREAIFCIPPERKDYFERDDLFGSKVAVAFPSCARDIQKAGSCYALGQEDACVHHLMLVLERGLNAFGGERSECRTSARTGKTSSGQLRLK